jgi:hypothetical protein
MSPVKIFLYASNLFLASFDKPSFIGSKKLYHEILHNIGCVYKSVTRTGVKHTSGSFKYFEVAF